MSQGYRTGCEFSAAGFTGRGMNFDEQIAELERGADEVLVQAELVRKLGAGRRSPSRPASIRPRPTCISGTRCC